jgi:hypothetical protein
VSAACATSELPATTWDVDVRGGEGRKAKRARIAGAVAVCQTCPRLTPCGQLADERRDVGVWGGRYRGFNAARLPRVSHDPDA